LLPIEPILYDIDGVLFGRSLRCGEAGRVGEWVGVGLTRDLMEKNKKGKRKEEKLWSKLKEGFDE
jgi:hypothetical protein